MKTFVAGALLGALLCAGVLTATGVLSPEPAGPETPSLERSGAGPSSARQPAADPAPPAARLEGAPPPKTPHAEPFAPGTAWLHVGEGYVFGDPHARAGEAGASSDVYCQDIRYGASLRCPHGAALPRAPMSAVGMPEAPVDVAGLLSDAPTDFSLADLWLLTRATAEKPGVGFVRSAEGTVYKVHLATLEPHPEVLQRRVQIRYEAVPVVEGGGELALPVTDDGKPVPVAARKALRKALAYRTTLRNASFVDHLSGNYEVLPSLDRETTFAKERYVLLEAPLTTKVVIPRRGGLFAAGGIDPDGHVVLDSYAGVGTAGDLLGTVDVKSYGYVHIDGDLEGTVNVRSYATVIVEGDLTGTLVVRSYTTLLLRGRVFGTLDCHGSCWSTFYLDGFWSEADLEALGDGFRSVRLHVRASDLAPGKHADVGSWREVVVGDPVWEKLGR